MPDFYSRVPKEKESNLRYRIAIRKAAAEDATVQSQLFEACRHDVLFFFNAFCWVYEPRPRIINGVRQPMVLPFITWPHQDQAIRGIHEHLGFEDVGVEKSRGEGMSWIGVLMALHSWLFDPHSKVGLVSRTERAADDPEDPDSLFWKIDWELTKLPLWMAGRPGQDWKRVIDRHTLTNYRNGARITAGAATGDVFRGGRLTWALMDEFAFFKKGEDKDALNSSHGATNSRLFVSTVNGQNNEYFRIMHEPSSMVKVIIDWKQNVSRNRGLYVMKRGRPKAIDPENNPLPPHYDPPSQDVLDLFSRLRKKGFRLEDCERSPWYDHECDRPGMTPQRIAQELDRDYAGSDYLVFGAEFRRKVKATVARPVKTGAFSVLPDTSEGELDIKVHFNTVHDGPCDLWLPLDVRGRPPWGMYALACDISTGLGGSHGSNSTIVGIDVNTREQVLGFASNTIEPADFADLAVGIANWMWGAYLGWEHNGPGAAFTKRVQTLNYGNLYRRKSHDRSGKRETKQLGWWTDDKTKPMMFAEANRVVRSSEVVVRCEKLATEFLQYVFVGGKIEHAASLMTEDDSSRGKAHGDRVIAFCVDCQLLLDRPSGFASTGDAMSQKNEFQQNTMAARMRSYAEEDRQSRNDPDAWRGSVRERMRR
ncbi:MAG: hypothetical protein AAF745_02605 [Planctomycetota bacterium]